MFPDARGDSHRIRPENVGRVSDSVLSCPGRGPMPGWFQPACPDRRERSKRRRNSCSELQAYSASLSTTNSVASSCNGFPHV